MSLGMFSYHNWQGKGRVLLASSEWGPGVLPNVLQCIGHPPVTENDLATTETVPRLMKPYLKGLG